MNNKWVVFVLTAFGVFMSTLDGSVVNIALPAILDDFEARLSVVEWVVMIYLLTVTAFLLGAGRLSDIYGRRRIYITGLLLFSLSSLLCGLSPNVYFLIFSRMIQGFSSAMIMACTPALLVAAFPVSERGKIFGINSMVVACGLTAGPAIGGLLIEISSWRLIFYLNVPIGIIAAVGSYFVMKPYDKSESEAEFDLRGTIYAALGTGLFLVAVTHGYEWGFGSFKFAGSLAAGICLIALFLKKEKHAKDPVLNLRIFKSRMLSISALSGVLLFMILFVIIFLMPFFLMKPMGLDSKTSGYILMVPFAFLFFVSPVSGNLSDYFGSRILCTIGLFIITCGVLLFTTLTPDSSIIDICLRLSLIGIGTSVFISPNSAAIMSSIPQDLKGTGGAIMATSRNLGMVLGIASAGALFNFVFHNITANGSLNNYSPEMEEAFMAAFKFTIQATAVLAASATVITALRGPEQSRQRRQ
jgi:EmrB/QacA subfamily drug resistance transporter